jgi:hypothetical protein
MRRVCLALGFVVACSGSQPATNDAKKSDGPTTDAGPDLSDGAHSGSRLKITYWAFADGTRSWNNFYDAQRKENCYLSGPWTDGNYYCTPNSSGSIVWSNATCSTKMMMYYVDPSCPTPPGPYILDYSFGCAFQYSHLYMRGAQLGATQYYYQNSDGSCGGPYTATGYNFYALGTEIVPSQALVQITPGAPMGSGTITERFLTSSDGLQFPWTAHDATLGADCYPSSYGATSATCIPDASYAYYFHDAQCSVPESSVGKTCASPKYLGYSPTSQCPTDPPKYYTAGSSVTNGASIYYQSNASCASQPPDTTQTYYGLGQQLSLSVFSRAPDTLAGHRIQLIHETAPDGVKMRDYALYDSQLGSECYPISMPDGTTRCLTFGADIQSYFKDAACTQAIDLAAVSSGPASCGTPVAPTYASKYIPPAAGSCSYSYEMHRLGTAYNGAIYYVNGTCMPYPLFQQKMYTVGALVDLTTYASATSVTDQ